MADHNEIKMKRMHASAFFEQCVERLELFYAPASQFFFLHVKYSTQAFQFFKPSI